MTRRESAARRASEGVEGKTTTLGPACAIDDRSEWLEPDGLGGYASGTATGISTRRYHALLLASARPPVDRYVLVNTLEAWVECGRSVYPLTSQRYAPGITHPLGTASIRGFSIDPWPTWDIQPAPGVRIRHERLVRHGEPTTLLTWSLAESDCPAQLVVRLLMSGRDYHSLHHANAAFRFDSDVWGGRIQWEPYAGVPSTVAITNGDYEHRPDWYRGFQYEEERARGQECVEDLASPGVLRWDLSKGPAVLVLSAKVDDEPREWTPKAAVSLADRIKQTERTRRAAFRGPLHRAADAYIVVRQLSPEVPAGKTIVAGYPWFTDWGRDTFISLRGLCLARGAERLDDARDILLTWAALVSEGMLPNRLPDRGTEPEYNAADASLWFVLAAGAYLGASRAAKHAGAESRKAIIRAIIEIVEGYSKGTRYGIGLDRDGLVRAGVAGVQLTWMDAKVGDWVVTPRIGKPVELQALWLNALRVYAEVSGTEHPAFAIGMESFAVRFWDARRGWLCDVVDVDHKPGALDETFRPNQLYAVGGLPLTLVDESICARVVDRVEHTLMTPKGPRSLAPDDPGYRGRYEGDLWARDGAYHMGTVWPYLSGPFVEAWVRARGGTPDSKREARERFLGPLLASMASDGLGHISEIADGDPPHAGRGCPFQAWSVAEALRLDRDVLSVEEGFAAVQGEGRRKVIERR